MLLEAKNEKYTKHAYLNNIPISYIEALYEVTAILRTVTGLYKRTAFFFDLHRDSFDNFIEQLIELGFFQLSLKCLKDLSAFLFCEKMFTVLNLFDYLISVYLNNSHSKLSKLTLTRIVNEICELFCHHQSFNLMKEHKDNPEVKEFLENLANITRKSPHLLKETTIEIYLSQLGLFDDIQLDKNFRILSIHNSPVKKPRNSTLVKEKKNATGFILSEIPQTQPLPLLNSQKSTSWEKVDLRTSTYEFLITPTKEKRKEENIVVNSDPYDEYSILTLIDYSIKMNDYNKVNKIIAWRKKILEVTKINGWIIGKILAKNTLNKFEVNDIDIIEANLTFMEKFNIIDKNIKNGENTNVYKHVLEQYESLLLKSLTLDNLN
jgi:hypothetical protein